METSTLAWIGAALAVLAVFSGWRGARPPNPMKGARMVPWRFIMMLATAGAVLLLGQSAHMALAG